MRIAVCDDNRQDACALRALLEGQEVKLYGDAESLLADVRQGSAHYDLYAIQYLIKPVSREHVLSIRCTDGRVQESTGKLNDMERQICGDTFLRCHQSFIVNIYHVEGMSGLDLTVAGERIPASRRYYAEMRKRYQQILFEGVDL